MENQENGNILKEKRKKRTTINNKMLRIIRVQVSNGLSNNEISTTNCISLSCARNIANKILQGLR